MPNYKQSSISGDTFQRSNQIVIDNPLGGVPRITFLEQEIITLSDGRTIVNNVPGVGIDFTASDTFDLVSPVDDSVIGIATHVQIQILLYSLYKQLRSAADGV